MVLHAVLAGQLDADRDAELLERVPYAYRLELERRDAGARSASLQALRLLADGVLRVHGTVLDISQLCFPGGGKPFMDGGPWSSISHSASRVAVAISDRCDVGLDLEDLTAHGEDREGFERWTAIEATLKAVGAGLAAITGSQSVAGSGHGGHRRRACLHATAVAPARLRGNARDA